MTTTITLKIDRRLAKRVIRRAEFRKMSVEKMLEQQIEELMKDDEDEIAPAVKELAGVLKGVKVKNAKNEFSKQQLKKHRA